MPISTSETQIIPRLPTELIIVVASHMQTDRSIMWRSAVYSCCLVCRVWSTIFTPILYRTITLRDHDALLFRQTLRRREQNRPSFRSFIEDITIFSSEESALTTTMIVSLYPQNMRTLVIYDFDEALLHHRFARCMAALSKRCTIRFINKTGRIPVGSIPQWITFLRSSQPACCELSIAPEAMLNVKGR